MSIAGFMYSSLFCSASNSDNGILDNNGVLRNLNTSLFAPSISCFLLRYMSSLIIQCSTSIHTGDVELVFGSSC